MAAFRKLAQQWQNVSENHVWAAVAPNDQGNSAWLAVMAVAAIQLLIRFLQTVSHFL